SRAWGHGRRATQDASDCVDRMAEQGAVGESCAAAESAHRLAELRLDEGVYDHGGPAAHPVDGELEVVLGLDPRMADLDEVLLGELRLERLDESRGGLAGGVGDDVQLDGRVRHRRSA